MTAKERVHKLLIRAFPSTSICNWRSLGKGSFSITSLKWNSILAILAHLNPQIQGGDEAVMKRSRDWLEAGRRAESQGSSLNV